MSSRASHDHVNDPRRLAALRAIALLDTPAEEAFDRLSMLAARFTRAPVALVSLVDSDRQFFKSCIGLPEPWSSQRETPLSHSFCQHNRVAGVPLIISNAREHPQFCDNLAIRDLQVIAYLGIPLATDDGYVLGSFCVIDSTPRDWSEQEVETVTTLAAAVMTEIDLRTQITERKKIAVDHNKLSAIHGALQKEIVARKRAEEEHRNLEVSVLKAQKMEALGTLAGGIAHDFNNILSPLLGYAELLRNRCEDNQYLSSCAEEIIKAGLRARDLVQQVLAFSSQIEDEAKPMEIHSIVVEALKLLRSSLPKSIDIVQEISPDCGAVVTNSTQIHQVVMNLATNAFHAMQDGGGTLTVSLKKVYVQSTESESKGLAPGTYVRLCVSDTGSGIDSEILDRIFEPYFTTKGVGRGTGLGLAIVHRLAKRCRGSICIDSEVGKGTCVEVYYPLSDIEVGNCEEDNAQIVNGGRERVFLVDDEAPIADVQQRMLEHLGYSVKAYTDSASALAAIQRTDDCDLLITDMSMPGMSGIQLCRAARKLRPGLPVIICTGYSDEVTAENFAELGFQGYLVKPFSQQQLADTVRATLDSVTKG